jgi:hypothetical protein
MTARTGAAVFFGRADLERQFALVLKEWINAPKFQGLQHDQDPIARRSLGNADRLVAP